MKVNELHVMLHHHHVQRINEHWWSKYLNAWFGFNSITPTPISNKLNKFAKSLLGEPHRHLTVDEEHELATLLFQHAHSTDLADQHLLRLCKVKIYADYNQFEGEQAEHKAHHCFKAIAALANHTQLSTRLVSFIATADEPQRIADKLIFLNKKEMLSKEAIIYLANPARSFDDSYDYLFQIAAQQLWQPAIIMGLDSYQADSRMLTLLKNLNVEELLFSRVKKLLLQNKAIEFWEALERNLLALKAAKITDELKSSPLLKAILDKESECHSQEELDAITHLILKLHSGKALNQVTIAMFNPCEFLHNENKVDGILLLLQFKFDLDEIGQYQKNLADINILQALKHLNQWGITDRSAARFVMHSLHPAAMAGVFDICAKQHIPFNQSFFVAIKRYPFPTTLLLSHLELLTNNHLLNEDMLKFVLNKPSREFGFIFTLLKQVNLLTEFLPQLITYTGTHSKLLKDLNHLDMAGQWELNNPGLKAQIQGVLSRKSDMGKKTPEPVLVTKIFEFLHQERSNRKNFTVEVGSKQSRPLK